MYTQTELHGLHVSEYGQSYLLCVFGVQLESDLCGYEEQIVRLDFHHGLLDGRLLRVWAPVLGVRSEGGVHSRSSLLHGEAC